MLSPELVNEFCFKLDSIKPLVKEAHLIESFLHFCRLNKKITKTLDTIRNLEESERREGGGGGAK